ncbi:aldose epimerase family protein [Agromyces silvae]|uniref:hypothetical protein n=1 Tax=Agromyces silvae TaxID=3388266 RepID=UPI00280B6B15|nr:hypothetical protein [Agromyces protaetiae]
MSDDHLVALDTDEWRVTAAPGHGGTLIDIRPAGVDANLLWQRAGESPRRVQGELGEPGPASISTFDQGLLIGGWFVMFPTAGQPGDDPAEPTWQHGWAPRRPWSVTMRRDAAFAMSLTYGDGRRCIRLRRVVSIRRSALIVSTLATHLGGAPLRYSAGEHPCLDRALFAGGTLEARNRDAPVIAVPIEPEPDGLARHRVFEAARRTVLITAPLLGGSLEITSDLPYAVLWERRSAAAGMDVIAWEPASAPGLGWSEACLADAVRVLSAGERTAWRTTLRWVRDR